MFPAHDEDRALLYCLRLEIGGRWRPQLPFESDDLREVGECIAPLPLLTTRLALHLSTQEQRRSERLDHSSTQVPELFLNSSGERNETLSGTGHPHRASE